MEGQLQHLHAGESVTHGIPRCLHTHGPSVFKDIKDPCGVRRKSLKVLAKYLSFHNDKVVSAAGDAVLPTCFREELPGPLSFEVVEHLASVL